MLVKRKKNFLNLLLVCAINLVGITITEAANQAIDKNNQDKITASTSNIPSNTAPEANPVSNTPTSEISLPSIPAMNSTDNADSLSLLSTFTPDQIQWIDAPSQLPAETKMVVLAGDPGKPGPFTMRLKLPANYMISPHTHPGVEHITVISGIFNLGAGQKFDSTNGKALPVGSFIVIQPGVAHFSWGVEETILQIHGTGPWNLVYVNQENTANNPINTSPMNEPIKTELAPIVTPSSGT